MRYYEVVGNLHVHTVYSDGTADHRGVARAAARAGLDFVVVTDHNVWVHGVEGYTDGVLLLVGEEVHSVRRYPQVNHLLVYGAEAELAPRAADPQQLIHEVAERGGICFLAHPYEKGSPISPDLEPIPWVDWEVDGYAGLEIWNAMSEFKGLLWGRPAALFYALFPELGIRGPFPATLRRWDALLRAGRKVTAIGGADAHGHTYRLGPIQRVVFPYDTLFRWVNTHVLVEQPLTGDIETDRRWSTTRYGRGAHGWGTTSREPRAASASMSAAGQPWRRWGKKSPAQALWSLRWRPPGRGRFVSSGRAGWWPVPMAGPFGSRRRSRARIGWRSGGPFGDGRAAGFSAARFIAGDLPDFWVMV